MLPASSAGLARMHDLGVAAIDQADAGARNAEAGGAWITRTVLLPAVRRIGESMDVYASPVEVQNVEWTVNSTGKHTIRATLSDIDEDEGFGIEALLDAGWKSIEDSLLAVPVQGRQAMRPRRSDVSQRGVQPSWV